MALHARVHPQAYTRQSELERAAGIHSLHMNTNGGGPGSCVVIRGIKDCLKVRDMLSEIDSLRENQ